MIALRRQKSLSRKQKQPDGLIKRLLQYFSGLQVVDYRVIISVVFLMMFGFLMIYSATNAESGASVVYKQILIGGLGIAIMIILAFVDYHKIAKLAVLLYIVSLGSMFLVLFPGLGVTVNGASRWIIIGPFRFQPSELSKPAIIILIAVLMAGMVKRRKLRSLIDVVKAILTNRFTKAIAAGVISSAVIFKITSNLSTAIIVLGITAFMLYVAFPNKIVYILIAAGIIAAAIFAYVYYIQVIQQAHISGADYRALRILAWLYPNDYLDNSMQSRYALYAIGFGGVLGRGLGHGVMKYYIPEAENDFIFAVIGEELGLVGCAMVLFLFIYQIWRLLVISRHARDKLGSYLVFGVAAHVALQVLLHIAVVTSVLPNTGISLPYISYGGTALLVQLGEIGIVLNVSKQIPGKKIVIQGMGENTVTQTGKQRKTKAA